MSTGFAPGPSEPCRPGELSARPDRDAAPVAMALERLRVELHRRLDRLATLAQALSNVRPESPGSELLSRRIHELDQERERLHAEAQEREREWAARLEVLDEDRALLADAWERLEQERVEAQAGARGRSQPRASSRSAENGEQPLTPQSVPPELPVAGDAASQMMIRQFESLRHDVRLRAQTRAPERTR